jgi:hypothetical protein
MGRRNELHTWEPLGPVYFRLPLLNDLLCNIGDTFRLRGPQLAHCQPGFAFLDQQIGQVRNQFLKILKYSPLGLLLLLFFLSIKQEY